jgi:hypothetical protein
MLFSSRILSFGQLAAKVCEKQISRVPAASYIISAAYRQVAPMTTARSFAVATSNPTPFEVVGVLIINP